MSSSNVQFDFEIPDVQQVKQRYNDPSKYLLSEEIASAVKAAMSLGQPLFITGEPGTGKTQLAFKIAHDFGLKDDEGNARPLIFNTKTTSTARDLFYLYDAVRHFRDANMRKEGSDNTMAYVELQALGRAIAATNPAAAAKLGMQLDEPRHSLVLIDEIDKAPTDFPNDILYELENMAFEIKETGDLITSGNSHRPIVIMTSNSEKSLPDAFLRRCVFLHIEFPGADLLTRIILSKLGEAQVSEEEARKYVAHFEKIREAVKKKKPATAELIGWIRMLKLEGLALGEKMDSEGRFRSLSTEERQRIKFSYGVLAKNKDDLAILEQTFLT